jgi:hypothetical protein
LECNFNGRRNKTVQIKRRRHNGADRTAQFNVPRQNGADNTAQYKDYDTCLVNVCSLASKKMPPDMISLVQQNLARSTEM